VRQVPSVDSISFITMSAAVYPAAAAAARLAQTTIALRDFAQQQQLPPPPIHAAPAAAADLPLASSPAAAAAAAADSEALARQLVDLCAARGGQLVTASELAALPVYVQLDDVPSDFVEIRVVLNTAPLRCALRPCLLAPQVCLASLPACVLAYSCAAIHRYVYSYSAVDWCV